ncbi:ADP-ribosylation factor-like protein 9 isoform 1-T1 [Ara ararauna]
MGWRGRAFRAAGGAVRTQGCRGSAARPYAWPCLERGGHGRPSTARCAVGGGAGRDRRRGRGGLGLGPLAEPGSAGSRLPCCCHRSRRSGLLSVAHARGAWLSVLPLASQGTGHGKQILVLGLDGAGKTSVLHSLATNHVKRSMAPTEGFNAICVSTEELQMEFLEIGGSESLRSYWKMYLPKVLLLIYVVDSADHARLPVAKQLLHQLIQNYSTLPVVVLANKQDLEGAYCITDIHDALALSDIGDNRKMFLIGTHVAEDGSEISSNMKDAKELIAQLVLEAQ